MARRMRIAPPEDRLDEDGEVALEQPQAGATEPDLAALPIAGLNQRKVATLLGVLVAAWIILLFAREVGDASAASARADAMIADNATRKAQVAALDRELARIQQSRFVLLQARAHGLGGHNEIAFTLEADAAPLPSDAPGSAASRVGAPDPVSPLDHWLALLFGSGG